MGAVYIDVSQWNGNINWNRVDADGVFIRVAYRGYSNGVIKQDKKCIENLQGATAKGIPVGLYFMSQAINEKEAQEEADYCLELAKKYKVSLPIVFDCEYSGEANKNGRADGLKKPQRTSVVIAFCERIKSGGKIPGVYSSTSWYNGMLDADRLRPKKYFIWCAQYNVSCKLTALEWDLWQYTSKGSIDGISGNVDISKSRDNRILNVAKFSSEKTANSDQEQPLNSSDKIHLHNGFMSLSRSQHSNARFYDGSKATNFKVSEFACKDGSDKIIVDTELVKLLQKIREHFNRPLLITSAYRTKEYNKKVGGAANSYHTKGSAADITVSGISNRDVAKYAATICKGVGFYNYSGGFVHVDTREKRYLWQQDKKNSKYYQVSSF